MDFRKSVLQVVTAFEDVMAWHKAKRTLRRKILAWAAFPLGNAEIKEAEEAVAHAENKLLDELDEIAKLIGGQL